MERYPSTSNGSGSLAGALGTITRLPQVQAAVEAARQACDDLAGHPGLRGRLAPARVEASVWAAWASARLEGVDLPVDLVRRAVSGGPLPADATGRVLAGAVRAVTQADRVAFATPDLPARAPRHLLARLHLAAAQGLEPEADLGRPRPGVDPGRLQSVYELVAVPDVPALVVVALADAELSTVEPFATSSGVVARALARAVGITRGLDPTGLAVAEVAMVRRGDRAAALQAYRSGTPDGVSHWVRCWGTWLAEGAAHGRLVADSLAVGRPLQD